MSSGQSNEKINTQNNINIDYDQKEVIKENYIGNIKNDLKNKVIKYGYIFTDATISVAVNYEIQNIELKITEDKSKGEKITELSTISQIIKEISSEYKINESKIKITKLGGENN